jgi:glycosyltransferase involved in cell wall biosynthesis
MSEDDRPAATDTMLERDDRIPPPPSSVLLVTQFWGRDGGVAAHVKASAALLARNGVHVQVLAAGVEPHRQTPGVAVHHRPELFTANAPMGTRLGEAITPDPEVIHFHRRADAAIVDRLRRIAPVVFSAHGYAACTSGVHFFAPGQECTRAHGPGCAVNLAVRGCAHTRRLQSFPAKYKQVAQGLQGLRRADLVLAYSSAIDRHLSTNGLTRRKVIPLFTTMAAKTGSGHATRRRVVFAGRIAGPKGPAVLIHAARDVDAEFVFCGEGRQLAKLRELALRLGVERRVHFKGWLDAEQLAEELANASILVMPSRWPEPFGLVGIEALAAGRPVIASATGGIVDWLEDGVTGLRVRAGDAPDLARALNELLADPERQRIMGAAGREMVAARFSPERHVAALLESYRAARSTWQSTRDTAQS